MESGRVQRGWRGPLNDVEETRGGCLLVLRHNLLVFITDDALGNFCPCLFPPPSYGISPLSSSRSFPPVSSPSESSVCSCLPAKHDQSLFPVCRHDTPFTPTAEEALPVLFVKDKSFRLLDERVNLRVTIIVRSHIWIWSRRLMNFVCGLS